MNTCKANLIVKGDTVDKIYVGGKLVKTIEGHNLIVNSYCNLVAAMLKGDTSMSGIQYWAVGSGADNWDIPAVAEVERLVVQDQCYTTGSVSVSVGGITRSINVASGETAAEIADKILTCNFSGWAVTKGANDNEVIFTADKGGSTVSPTFNAYSTGVVAKFYIDVQGIDAQSRPSPLPEDTGCENEFFRKAIDPNDIVYINDSGEITSAITNIIQTTVTFSESEANGEWREFSIVGGNATADLGSGTAINHRIHGLITKTSDMTVERTIRITVTLG